MKYTVYCYYDGVCVYNNEDHTQKFWRSDWYDFWINKQNDFMYRFDCEDEWSTLLKNGTYDMENTGTNYYEYI